MFRLMWPCIDDTKTLFLLMQHMICVEAVRLQLRLCFALRVQDKGKDVQQKGKGKGKGSDVWQ